MTMNGPSSRPGGTGPVHIFMCQFLSRCEPLKRRRRSVQAISNHIFCRNLLGFLLASLDSGLPLGKKTPQVRPTRRLARATRAAMGLAVRLVRYLFCLLEFQASAASVFVRAAILVGSRRHQ
jgi:hypothetical protein